MIEYYHLGMRFWNRNKIDDAKICFNKILKNIEYFGEYEKTNVAKFYMLIEEKETSTKILKAMIYKYENIYFSVDSYLDLKQNDIFLEDLNFIRNIPILKNNININYKIAKIYYEKEQILRSYEIIANIIDYIERSKNTLQLNVDIYIKSIILMIEMEYKLENYVQCRFQIRKIINKEFEIDEYNLEKIIYWSILLDVLDEIVLKESWIERIRNIENKDLKILIHTLIKIYKQNITMSTYSLLKKHKFKIKDLEDKANVLSTYIEKCIGNEAWKISIDDIDIRKHLLGFIMYFEKYKESIYFDAYNFFDRYFAYHADRYQIINMYWNLKDRKKEEKEDVLKDISIQFIGGADQIGGSCILIRYKDTNILMDAGANIGDEYYPKFKALKDENLSIKDIDYLIISHAHLDHIGSLPYIYKENSDIKIISTIETKDIMKIMLEDVVRNNKKESIDIDINDIKNSLSSVITKKFNEEIVLTKDIKLTLYRAGHILGASCVALNIEGLNILYTGDYCIHNQYTVDGMDLPLDIDVDILITESTYAYNPNNFNLSKENQEKLFIDDILDVINKNGVALIPAFAIGRAQELILTLKNKFKEYDFLPFDLYVDGKVVEICDLYQKYISEHDIYGNGVSTVNDRYKEINERTISKFKGSCIIASSGMLNQNSRSSKYANAIVEDADSAIFFSGYLDEESPGKHLLNKIQTEVYPSIMIENQVRQVKCNIKSYKLSAHIKKYELLQMILKLKPRYIYMVHGEINNKYKYFDNEEKGKIIYPEIDSFTKYIKDINIIKPINGKVYSVNKK